jgi:hypothetical protein
MRSARAAGIVLSALLVLAPVVSACGGGGDSGGGNGGGGGSDQAYVTGLCKGISQFSDAMDAALSGPTPTDIGQAFAQIFEAMAKPLQQFSDSFAKLKPPSDLADWHKRTAQQLSDAAKALKSGNLDDPALAALGDSPVPNMPDGPRERLKTLADKTTECGKTNPFDESSAVSSSGSGQPTQALVDAANGTWTGKFGTLTFNSDGTAKFELKNCGTSGGSNTPFGVIDDCTPDTYSGKIRVGANEYTFTGGDMAGISLDAYVAKDKTLHVGVGTIGAFGPGQKGTVDVFAAGVLTVDGTNCTMKDFANSKDSKTVACSWKKEEGQDVLEFEGGFSSAEKLVILRDEGLAVSPEIFVASFTKK